MRLRTQNASFKPQSLMARGMHWGDVVFGADRHRLLVANTCPAQCRERVSSSSTPHDRKHHGVAVFHSCHSHRAEVMEPSSVGLFFVGNFEHPFGSESFCSAA